MFNVDERTIALVAEPFESAIQQLKTNSNFIRFFAYSTEQPFRMDSRLTTADAYATLTRSNHLRFLRVDDLSRLPIKVFAEMFASNVVPQTLSNGADQSQSGVQTYSPWEVTPNINREGVFDLRRRKSIANDWNALIFFQDTNCLLVHSRVHWMEGNFEIQAHYS